jgi:hypothetical protein
MGIAARLLGDWPTIHLSRRMSHLSRHSDAGKINRAEEARVMSERMVDAYTKFLMLGIADTYERIAKSYDLIAIFEQPLDTK